MDAPADVLAHAVGPGQARLTAVLRSLGGAVVAFSGGVDSAYLLAAAHDVLGARCVGATAVSPSLAREELEAARRTTAAIGARWMLVETDEFDDPRYVRNDPQRCYFCKHALFVRLRALAADLDLPVVAFGATLDDRGDFRPGMRAAEKHGARAPLLEAGLGKAEIRALARARGLEAWDKPASPCLASRIPFGTPVTVGALAAVEASERVLHVLGFREVRVRHHGEAARIEVPLAEIPRLLEVLPRIAGAFRAAGYRDVQVAPDGLRSGRFAAALAPAARDSAARAVDDELDRRESRAPLSDRAGGNDANARDEADGRTSRAPLSGHAGGYDATGAGS